MRVLVGMSGGVDSSVAAALLCDAGHEVVGVTLKLWGGHSESGCCTVRDADDARRVADVLGLDHYVWSYAEEFEARVVDPYVAAHAAGRTPNPCADCNRHLKWGALLDRAKALGFDAVATGHHAGIVEGRLVRGADRAKDQSYVLATLSAEQLASTLLPLGAMTKAQVRERAARLGLRTAAKPDSQDLCFVARSDRAQFLSDRLAVTPARVVDTAGEVVGEVPAAELVTVGQRKGLGVATGDKRYAVAVDVAAATVTVGAKRELMADEQALSDLRWHRAPNLEVLAQTTAHGPVRAGRVEGDRLVWSEPTCRVAPGQVVALYDPARPTVVVGSARAA